MPSRDYLIRQIEEMGIFLALLLRKVLKLKDENASEQMELTVKEALSAEADFDIDQAIMLENSEFLKIASSRFSSDAQLEKLADILKTLGTEIEKSFTLNRANYLRKALFLYIHLQESSADFSFERKVKIEEIQHLMRIHEI
jgi:hypothetical protein